FPWSRRQPSHLLMDSLGPVMRLLLCVAPQKFLTVL
ncbi:hypothetical protein V3C99_009821, partial [Haemonchus contortus]